MKRVSRESRSMALFAFRFQKLETGRAGSLERVQNVEGLPFRLRRRILIGKNANDSARLRAKPRYHAFGAQKYSTRYGWRSNERLHSDQLNGSVTPRGNNDTASRRGIDGSECRSNHPAPRSQAQPAGLSLPVELFGLRNRTRASRRAALASYRRCVMM